MTVMHWWRITAIEADTRYFDVEGLLLTRPQTFARYNHLTKEVPPGISVGLFRRNTTTIIGEHQMKTTIFKIEGMNCDACANAIKILVDKEPGVKMASVSYGDKQARVLFDPKSVEEVHLVNAIQKPGFRVVGREELK